ncbi:uncharacterized protein LOC119844114 [Dermochelys coriacea]|uniref:uncharacterized protein LOC119844114 n=1 Tax=Dermochelys coriacea TaxID=27794 RepID=UPI001CA7C3EE|nr:uncharacterized protein LOC119844114 [Dermochelys coriacea]XP_043355090.1 uncharacterized protein LOC119844114 [Dermochelys coriacea]
MPFPSRAQHVGVIPDSGKGRGFCCDLCSSPYTIDPGRRGNQLKTSSSLPSPRHKREARPGQVLTLCNACGLTLSRPRSTPNPVKDPGPDERKRHEEQLQAFGRSMVELLGDQDGSKLCCPAYTRKPCLCLQNYLKAPASRIQSHGPPLPGGLHMRFHVRLPDVLTCCSRGRAGREREPYASLRVLEVAAGIQATESREVLQRQGKPGSPGGKEWGGVKPLGSNGASAV